VSLLRVLRGQHPSLDNVSLQDGNVYVCTDDGTVYFDYPKDDGNILRQQLNAGDAATLTGASLSTSLNLSDTEIPTSKTIIENVVLVTPQELTLDEVNQVRQNIHSVGQYTTGLTYYPFNVTEVIDYDNFTKELLDPIVAKQGAEIYNDYESNIATGMWAIARGCGNQALGDFSDASGWLTKATAFCSISSGRQTVASGPYSHAEGHRTQALKNDSHAEGEGSMANGARAHAEGYFTQANSNQAHAEGMNTIASGINSHAEGWGTTASGQNAFSGGKFTTASGTNSFANGLYTVAAGAQQVVHGKYNVSDKTSLFILGNGTSDTERSNAFMIDGSGNVWLSGNIRIGGSSFADGQQIYTPEEIDALVEDAIVSWGEFS
jgi:hypothetical protein